jgi:hypothetical protein
LIALVGVLFTAFANHRLTLWRERNARRISAAVVFRKGFCASIEPLLRNEWNLQSDQTVKAALANQRQAVEDFSVFLGWERLRFNRAWHKYRAYSEALNYAEYSASGLYLETLKQQGLKRPPDPRQQFIKLANIVLSYAKET